MYFDLSSKKQNIKLLQNVYYLFIVEIGINLNEEQIIELFDLAGQKDNIKVLKYLHDKFIEETTTRGSKKTLFRYRSCIRRAKRGSQET